MKILFTALVLFTFLGCSNGEIKQKQDEIQPEPEKTIETEIEKIMKFHNAVGLSVAAVQDGKIIYSKAFGLKDLENKTPYKEDDVLRIASISKTFVATSIMQLIEQGKLSLNTDVSTIPGFENIRNPHFPNIPITVHMLLSHTSSLSDKDGYYTLDRFGWNNYKPGSKYQYCNLGYNTLGAIIEIISGERFDKYVKAHILDPLGVYASYNVSDLDHSKFVKIYKYNSNNKSFTCSTSAYNYPEEDIENYKMGYSATCFSPTGGLKISAKDLAKVMMMHMNLGELNGVKILSKESCELMQAEHTSTNYPGESYGYAMISTNDLVKGHRLTGHDGIALGAYTIMYWDKEKNFGVVAMTNGCDGKTDKTFVNILCNTAQVLYNHFITK